MQRMEVTSFVTKEYGNKPNHGRSRTNAHRTFLRRKRSEKREKLDAHMLSMLIKVGICAVVALLLFVLKLLDTPTDNQPLKEAQNTVDEEMDIPELFGKLQFVELPSVAEVFAQSQKFSMPIEGIPQLADDGRIVLWKEASGKTACICMDGTVKAIGEHDLYGQYVRIAHKNDLETIYYGLGNIRVEEGQTVYKQDTVGTVNDAGVFGLSILLEGRPQDPQEYLDMVMAG